MKNSIRNLLLIAALFIVVVTGAIFIVSKNNKPENAVYGIEENIVSNNINLYIKTEEQEDKFEIEVVENSYTVLNLLKMLSEQNGEFVFETKEYNFGPFITSINNITADDNSFWGLYINNKMAELGIAEQVVNPGDTVKFELTAINY